MSNVADICKLASKTAEDKRPWDNLMQEVAENCYPLRATFTQRAVYGMDFQSNLMDSAPVNMREELGNTPDAMLRQGNWFQVGTGDEDRDKDTDIARVLERATMLMRRSIDDPRMGFKPAVKEGDHDYVAFGQPVLSVEENADRSFPRVKAYNPADCCWGYDDDGELACFYRKVEMPARNIATLVKSGRWNGTLPLPIEYAAEKEPGKRFTILHAMHQTESLYGSDGRKMRTLTNMPYVSQYIWPEGEAMLHERGEPMIGYLTPRWRSFSSQTYGFSPAALNSLSDQRMLQMLAMIILEQGEKGLDPPLVAAAEVFTRDINMYAGGSTFVDLPDGASMQDVMTTIETSQGFQKGLELKQDLRFALADAWLLNKLYLPRSGDMRELEVMTRNEEFRRVALPFFQPIESDYHPKLLGKIFDRLIMMRLIPREMFPESLAGSDIHFTFTTPLNEIDGQKTVQAYQLAIQNIAAGSQVDESIGHLFDMKVATIDAVRGGGAKASWIFSGRKAEQKMEEAQMAQELAQANQVINAAATTTSNVAVAAQNAELAGLNQ